MPFVDAFWHIANFFMPSLAIAFVSAAMAKAIWRRELRAASWLRLGAWASAATAAVSLLGLVVFEHDGRMITYAGMVVACALALWWIGFRRAGG